MQQKTQSLTFLSLPYLLNYNMRGSRVGGQRVRTPWEITKLAINLLNTSTDPPREAAGPKGAQLLLEGSVRPSVKYVDDLPPKKDPP